MCAHAHERKEQQYSPAGCAAFLCVSESDPLAPSLACCRQNSAEIERERLVVMLCEHLCANLRYGGGAFTGRRESVVPESFDARPEGLTWKDTGHTGDDFKRSHMFSG